MLIRATVATKGPQLLLVIMLRGVGPDFIGNAVGRVGDTGALLGELQRCTLCIGEHRCLPPGRHQVEPQLAFTGRNGVLCVHVGAETTAIDLAGPEFHQLLSQVAGRVDSLRVRPAVLRYLLNDMTLVFPNRSRRASTVDFLS